MYKNLRKGKIIYNFIYCNLQKLKPTIALLEIHKSRGTVSFAVTTCITMPCPPLFKLVETAFLNDISSGKPHSRKCNLSL